MRPDRGTSHHAWTLFGDRVRNDADAATGRDDVRGDFGVVDLHGADRAASAVLEPGRARYLVQAAHVKHEPVTRELAFRPWRAVRAEVALRGVDIPARLE